MVHTANRNKSSTAKLLGAALGGNILPHILPVWTLTIPNRTHHTQQHSVEQWGEPHGCHGRCALQVGIEVIVYKAGLLHVRDAHIHWLVVCSWRMQLHWRPFNGPTTHQLS